MKALEHGTDSSNNSAAFKRAGLTMNPRGFSPVAFLESRQLIEMIDVLRLPDAGVDGSAESFVARELPRAAPVFGFRNADFFPDQ
jgi:hypothetical protein